MILYYITESFKLFRRAKLASLITLISTSVAILITSFALLLLLFSNTIEEKLKERIELNIFLQDSASVNEIEDLKGKFQTDDFIKSARFVSKEEAVDKFIGETGEDFRGVLEVNPLPSSFVINLRPEHIDEEKIQNLISKYEGLTQVDEITYDYTTTLSILKILDINKTLIIVLSLILIIISTYFVYSNNKLLLMSRSNQFNTMKLVGAKLSVIKIPILFNGILLGLLGAIICMIIFNFSLLLLTKIYYNLKFINILYMFNFVILALGILFGLIGSYISVRGISLRIVKF